MQAFQILVIVFCTILLGAYLRQLRKERLSQKLALETLEDEMLRRIKQIDALPVPVSVRQRAGALLREKGVVLDAQLEQYMVQGFKDYLIAVFYATRDAQPAGLHGFCMTSDTVDMLWHAWLEDEAYDATFRQLLGFPLTHAPEASEQVAAQRGPGNIDFLKTNPPDRAVATYRGLRAALPAAGRTVHYSALYLLDSLAKNPEGFYYNGAILGAFERAAYDLDPGAKRCRVSWSGSACGLACATGLELDGGHHGGGSSCSGGGGGGGGP
jgi:hypothetical protein